MFEDYPDVNTCLTSTALTRVRTRWAPTSTTAVATLTALSPGEKYWGVICLCFMLLFTYNLAHAFVSFSSSRRWRLTGDDPGLPRALYSDTWGLETRRGSPTTASGQPCVLHVRSAPLPHDEVSVTVILQGLDFIGGTYTYITCCRHSWCTFLLILLWKEQYISSFRCIFYCSSFYSLLVAEIYWFNFICGVGGCNSVATPDPCSAPTWYMTWSVRQRDNIVPAPDRPPVTSLGSA